MSSSTTSTRGRPLMSPMVCPKSSLTQWFYGSFRPPPAPFVTLARVNRHVAALAAACAACFAAVAPAHAFTAAEGRAAADRAAIAWTREHQQKDGAFVDYV